LNGERKQTARGRNRQCKGTLNPSLGPLEKNSIKKREEQQAGQGQEDKEKNHYRAKEKKEKKKTLK